jgi:hypothetical protein
MKESCELNEARREYRAAMRRYGEQPCPETRLLWMQAGRRLAAAVGDQLRLSV